MDSDSEFQCELKQYKNEIKDKLPFNNNVTKKLLDDLQNGIDDYIALNNVTSFNEILEHFGQAVDVAEDFINSTDVQVIKRKINVKKIIIAFVVIAILLVGIGVAKIAHDANKDNAFYNASSVSTSEDESNCKISEA